MNPQNPRTDRAWRHARAVYLWRLRQVLRTIPKDADGDQLLQWRLYAMRVVAMCGRRQLARVCWPWHPRRCARTTQLRDAPRPPRGRTSNPTAR